MENDLIYKDVLIVTMIEGIIVETFKDTAASKIRVRPVHPDLSDMKVVFPKHLRKDNPIGTRFRVDVRVSQKHHQNGLPNGNPYLYSFEKSISVICG